ncbi:MAG: site-2 protease family protein [Deltaproteobacteria bacterium]|nr:site-2 protease family protein [Deltaproteobacteria bacterium]
MNPILEIPISLAVLMMSASVHEASHALAAYRMGDPTAKLKGRLTINPLKHIDLLGSLALPLLLILIHGPIFGWAKPVPAVPAYFYDRRKGEIMVSLAGVAANLGLAVAAGIFLRILELAAILGGAFGAVVYDHVLPFFILVIRINFILLIINLIPIPPLDGHKALAAILPRSFKQAGIYVQAAGLALFVFLFAIFKLDGVLSDILKPLATLIFGSRVLDALTGMR